MTLKKIDLILWYEKAQSTLSTSLLSCVFQIYPMAVVATAERGLIVYQLENQPSEFRRIESPLKHQVSHKSNQEARI